MHVVMIMLGYKAAGSDVCNISLHRILMAIRSLLWILTESSVTDGWMDRRIIRIPEFIISRKLTLY